MGLVGMPIVFGNVSATWWSGIGKLSEMSHKSKGFRPLDQ